MSSKNQSNQGGGPYKGTGDKADLNNHAGQCNPNNAEYRGYTSTYKGDATKADLGNHGNQKNPNNPAYPPVKQ